MTITKMCKMLVQLIQEKGADYVVYRWIDGCAYWIKEYKKEEYTEKVPREIITLGDIFKQFEIKQGPIFEQFSSTASFREYFQWLKEGKVKDEEILYEDTFQEYKKMWEADHPGLNYEEELEKQRKIRRQKANRTLARMMGLYMPFVQPYLDYKEVFRW